MARENQGLQIALIIFFMLTIILGVTTFIFFRQYEEADKKAKTAQKDAADQGAAARAIVEECNHLKSYIGVAQTQKLEEVTAQYNQDMQEYGGASYPEENRNYHKMLEYLFQAIQDKHTELAALKAENQQLKDERETLEAINARQIEPYETARDDATKQLGTVTETAKSERDRITKDQASIAARLDEARKKATTDLTAVESSLEDARVRMNKLIQLNARKSEKLEEFIGESFEVPDGEIRWVNQHSRTVWIDLGRADSLARQITFSVYPSDTTNLTKAGKKASIEVTRIFGEHSAEARIIEDEITDPIMPGDKVHTPVWSPGEQKRFALAGFMDIDGDGKSDQHVVRNLITRNGGVVDCETDAEGKKRGKMTVNTRYLVVGEAPDAKSPKSVTDGYSDMIGDARLLGIQMKSLGELLQQMGWKNQTPVVRYGMGANPKDFRAKPPAGVPKVSRGNVSDLFKQRRPPPRKPSGRGGAY